MATILGYFIATIYADAIYVNPIEGGGFVKKIEKLGGFTYEALNGKRYLEEGAAKVALNNNGFYTAGPMRRSEVLEGAWEMRVTNL